MDFCKTCHGGCCRNYTVSLTGYDILNIAKTLGLPPAAFISIYPVETQEDIDYKSKHTALFKFLDDETAKYYIFGTRMVESALVPGTAKCQFLLEWNSDNEDPSLDGLVARCGIYSCRPAVCAAFPTMLDETDLHGRLVNTTNFEQRAEHPIYQLCPEAPDENDISDSDEIMKVLIMKKYEVDFFKSIAVEWNKNPRHLADFWEFLRDSYQNRVVVK